MQNHSLDRTNLDFLWGVTLIQVAIGENEVLLHTHPEVAVTIESDVEPGDDLSPGSEL